MLKHSTRLVSALRAPAARAMATKTSAASTYALTGLSEETFASRKVVIFRPSKSAMSSGKCHMDTWKLQFDMKHKWSNPLMGWTSGKDPMGTQLMETLTFDSAESASRYCDRMGLPYEIQEPEESEVIWTAPRNYADNFKWDGDEEDGNTGVGHWATKRAGTK